MITFKLQKLVEDLLINSLIYKNPKYKITEITSGCANTYEANGLKAEIEADAIWFSDNRLDRIIDDILDIEITDQVIKISCKEDLIILIEMDK